MKIVHKSIKVSFVAALVILSGCSKDFVTRDPLSQISADAYYTSKADMLAGTAGLYNLAWFDYNSTASWSTGDARGGVLYTHYQNPLYYQFRVTATEKDQLPAIWKSLYATVGFANVIARNINLYTKSTVAEEDKMTALGECKFMRGTAYFYLITNFGDGVPLLEDNNDHLYDVAVRRNTTASVYDFIVRDLTFAKNNLPLTPPQAGRLSSWAAKGMLAKIYMFRAAYKKGKGLDYAADVDSAKVLAGDVCKNSGLTLMPNYEDLFKTKNNSSKGGNTEYLFALQWVAGQGYSYGNLNQAFLAFDTKVTGQSDGWGGGVGASQSILKYYLSHPEDSFRRKATFFFPGEHYDYMSYPNADPDDPTKTVIGKLVVPSNNLYACVKKYIVGTAADNDGQVFPQGTGSTDINTYMLRLAEVYLIYAEAAVGLDGGSINASDDAWKYFDMVRQRAKVASIANVSFKEVYDEKRIELAMEAKNYYELVKIYYQDKQRAIGMIDTTDMTDYQINLIPNSSPRKWRIKLEDWYNYEFVHVEEGFFFLPVPANEIVQMPSLGEPAVDYDFSKYK